MGLSMKKLHLTSLLIITIALIIMFYFQPIAYSITTFHAHLNQAWYPQAVSELTNELNRYEKLTKHCFETPAFDNIRALIVPHAGYYYSGLCASSAYQAVNKSLSDNKTQPIKRMIILAPSHFVAFNGIALAAFDTYQTALGTISIDTHAIKKLAENPLFSYIPAAYQQEHSLEVQLPFLQNLITSFTLIPLIVGTINNDDQYQSIAHSIRDLWDNSTLLIISSDFIHYGKSYNYTPFTKNIFDLIKTSSSNIIQALIHQSVDQFDTLFHQTQATICGKNPLRILLQLIKQKNQSLEFSIASSYSSLHAHEIHRNKPIHCNYVLTSIPDNAIENCVQYIALICHETLKNTQHSISSVFTHYEKESLILYARKVLNNYFAPQHEQKMPELLQPIISSALEKPYGAFVTLTTKTGQLRGCVGTITTDQPLYKTVAKMALAAALNDSRFVALSKKEYADVTIDISILSMPHKVASIDQIILHKHGIILKKYNAANEVTHQAVFLAHVPREFNWTLEETLQELCIKAGLEKNSWQSDTQFEVFEEIVIKENKYRL